MVFQRSRGEPPGTTGFAGVRSNAPAVRTVLPARVVIPAFSEQSLRPFSPDHSAESEPLPLSNVESILPPGRIVRSSPEAGLGSTGRPGRNPLPLIPFPDKSCPECYTRGSSRDRSAARAPELRVLSFGGSPVSARGVFAGEAFRGLFANSLQERNRCNPRPSNSSGAACGS